MRVAVILTGALRTIKKTVYYLKANVLRDDVHIFACLQNDTNESEDEWNFWLREHLGDHIKSTIWYTNEKYPEWAIQRDRLLENMQLDFGWKNYLQTSGSMLEYFQLHLAYLEMYRYETLSEKYSYIIRTRTDTIYNKPVDFHWLNWSDEEIEERMNKIRDNLESKTNKNVFTYFMNTIISDDLIPNIKNIIAEYCPYEKESNDSFTASTLGDYIRNGRYILTIRKNNLYVVKRDLFYLIPSFGMMYGYFKSPNSDDYWFNAECQFRSACYHSCLSIFDYNTLLEDNSLQYAHLWNEDDFFVDGVCKPNMLYCVVRK